MFEFLANHIVSIVIALVGGGAWLFERRQRIASAKITEGDAVARMQSAYDKFVEDSQERYIELNAELKALKIQYTELDAKYSAQFLKCRECLFKNNDA